MENPYRPPSSNLQPGSDGNGIRRLPRFSTWFVVGLIILTSGIYQLYWLYTRSRLLNSLLPENPIPQGIVNFVLSSSLVLIGLIVISMANPENQTLDAVIRIINIVSSVGLLIWVFIFRDRLNRYNQVAPRQRHWLGPVLTFFFQVIYFQYKINRMIDDSGSPRNEVTLEV